MKKIVITGGPYSGKTTTLEYFSKKGYPVVPEAAIIIIDELNNELGSPENTRSWRNDPKNFINFQERVYQKQISLENEFDAKYEGSSETVFLDRGVVDGIAYYNLKKVAPLKKMMDSAKNRNYSAVVVLDTLKNFESRPDSGRISSYNDSLEIRNSLIKTYKELGYTTEFLPELPLEERVLKIKQIAGLQ